MCTTRQAGASPVPMPIEALLVLGFAVYSTANSTGYLSAMGTVETNMGFVSQLPFMMASCAAQTLAALAVMLVSQHRRRTGTGTGARQANGLLPCSIGYLLLLAGCAASVALGAFGAQTSAATATTLGIVRGMGSLFASVAWYELLIVYARRAAVPALLLAASALHASLSIALGLLAPAGIARQLAVAALYAVSWGVAGSLAARPAGHATAEEFTETVVFSREPGRGFASAWLCLLVCQFVVGIANTAVFESPFASALSSVNVDVCILTAAAVLAVLFVAARHLPDPEATFRVVMPVLLAVFTAAALASDAGGTVMAHAMIACYEAIAITYSVYLVQFIQQGRLRLHFHVAMTSGAAALTLLAGLAIGVGLNALSDNHGVPLFTLLAFVAIYPLGLAFLVMQRNRARTPGEGPHGDAAAQVAEAPVAVTPAPQEADLFAGRVGEFAQAHGLTARETQLASLLVRGHTVKSIGETLGITENTAWTHIRSIYAKCGVKTKQALIDLFEE